MTTPDIRDEVRLKASVDMLRRTGAVEVQIRWSDDEEPTVWMAVARMNDGWDTASASTAGMAAYRLAELLLDGSRCVHCGRVSSLYDDFSDSVDEQVPFICWYVFDPETERFRRSCEHDA
ncbi:MAG: hypothetical protein AB7O86_05710 [Porticoccaceae bacterium]